MRALETITFRGLLLSGVVCALASKLMSPGVAHAAEKTVPNPLSDLELELVGPVVDYVAAVPLPPIEDKPSGVQQRVRIFGPREHTSHANTLLQYDGVGQGLFLNYGTAKSQHVMDLAWTQQKQQPTQKEKWQAFAKLIKAVTDRYPNAVVQSDDSRRYDGQVPPKSAFTMDVRGSRVGDTIKIWQWTDLTGRGESTTARLVFDAETVELLSGEITGFTHKGPVELREYKRIHRGGGTELVALEASNHENLHLKINGKGTFEATGPWNKVWSGSRPDWKLVSKVTIHDSNWDDGVGRYFDRLAAGEKAREQAQADAYLEHAKKFAHETVGVPNQEVVRLMDKILAKSPSKMELSVHGEVLHQGYQTPVQRYHGRNQSGEVFMYADDGQYRRELTAESGHGLGQWTSRWASLEEVQLYLASLTKAAGDGAWATLSTIDGDPILFRRAFETDLTKEGHISVTSEAHGSSSAHKVGLWTDEVIFDRNLKVVGGTVLTNRDERAGGLRVHSQYLRTGDGADKLVETRWMLRENEPYTGNAYTTLATVGVFKVDEGGVHLAEEIGRDYEPSKWTTLIARKQGEPFGLNRDGMQLLEQFKAGKLPRPRLTTRKTHKH